MKSSEEGLGLDLDFDQYIDTFDDNHTPGQNILNNISLQLSIIKYMLALLIFLAGLATAAVGFLLVGGAATFITAALLPVTATVLIAAGLAIAALPFAILITPSLFNNLCSGLNIEKNSNTALACKVYCAVAAIALIAGVTAIGLGISILFFPVSAAVFASVAGLLALSVKSLAIAAIVAGGVKVMASVAPVVAITAKSQFTLFAAHVKGHFGENRRYSIDDYSCD